MSPKYVHLKVRTSYNYRFDSLIRMERLIKTAKKMGMKSIGIADESTLHSIVEFYELAIKYGIKPIIGCEFTVIEDENSPRAKVVLYAKDDEGYRNISKLSSLSHIRGSKDVFIKKEELQKMSKGLVLVLDVEDFFAKKETENIFNIVEKYSSIVLKEDFYLEIKDYGFEHQGLMKNTLKQLSKENGFKLVAMNGVKYFSPNEAKTREVLVAIQEKRKEIFEPKTTEMYLKTEEDMNSLFKDVSDAIENTNEISDKCNVTLGLKGTKHYERKLPSFKVPSDFVPPKTLKGKFDVLPNFEKPKTKEEVLAIAYLCNLAEKGFQKHYNGDDEETKQRLRYELGVVISKGFTNYFLIVQDFINYAKQSGIPIAPGRGSAAGSLLSRCLGITDVCPMEHNLLFERFLNPERTDDPDIDVDMSLELRYKMFEYAMKKYGNSHVAKIITFNNYGGKLAIRQVGRILSVKNKVVDEVAKSISKDVSELFQKGDFLQKMIEKEPKVKKMVEYSLLIQGLPQNRSIHAAGIILGENSLFEDIPLMITEDKEMNKPILYVQVPNTNGELERLGFTKIDFLALRTLDVIEKTKKLVEEKTGVKVEIPLDDERTYQLFQQGKVHAVFQLDSSEMQETSKVLKPKRIQDVFKVLAIYRPGSKDQILKYVQNKSKNETILYGTDGKPLEGVDDLMPILKRTYGILVYQEQIMKIAQVWAGYSLGQADLLRRAISKKKKEIIEKEKEIFVERSLKMNRDESISEKIYDLIKEFADYGFNESHAAAYGIMAYQTAYLKTNYTKEYMSVLISSVMDEPKKASDYIKEAKRMGIEVCKPNIHDSLHEFVSSEKGIIFGLSMVKNVGEKAAKAIVQERERGEFVSFENFLQRMNSRGVNKKVIDSLVKIGTFDAFGNRRQLLEAMTSPIKKNPLLEDQILFDDIDGVGMDEAINLPKVEEFTLEEKIPFEEELVCMTLSETPLQKNKDVLEKFVNMKNENEKSDSIWVGASIVSHRTIVDKNENEMAFLKITDGNEEFDVTVFNNLWIKLKEEFQNHKLYVFKVRKDKQERFIMVDFETPKESKKLIIDLDLELKEKSSVDKSKWMKELAELLKEFEGADELVLASNSTEKKYNVSIGEEFLKKFHLMVTNKESMQLCLVRYE